VTGASTGTRRRRLEDDAACVRKRGPLPPCLSPNLDCWGPRQRGLAFLTTLCQTPHHQTKQAEEQQQQQQQQLLPPPKHEGDAPPPPPAAAPAPAPPAAAAAPPPAAEPAGAPPAAPPPPPPEPPIGGTVALPAGPAPVLYYPRDGRPLSREIVPLQRAGVAEVEVSLPPELVTAANRHVRARQLWGDGSYTDDSDLVAVLMHRGHYAATHPPHPPPPAVAEVRARLALLPPAARYPSAFRNGVRSRAWHGRVESGCAYRVERAWVVTRAGSAVELVAPPAPDAAGASATSAADRNNGAASGGGGAPTLIPAHGDRHVATRAQAGRGGAGASAAAAAAAAAAKAALAEATVVYSLSNEPWLKYAPAAVADRGLAPRAWTSARLRSEVLFFETARERYQVAYAGTERADAPPGTGGDGARTRGTTPAAAAAAARLTPPPAGAAALALGGGNGAAPAGKTFPVPGAAGRDVYTLSRCRAPLPLAAVRRLGVPLPSPGHTEVVEEALGWEELRWGAASLRVRSRELEVVRVLFVRTPKAEQELQAQRARDAKAREAAEAAARAAEAARRAAEEEEEEEEEEDEDEGAGAAAAAAGGGGAGAEEGGGGGDGSGEGDGAAADGGGGGDGSGDAKKESE